MTGDVGRSGELDVVLVAEHLRRRVPGGIGTYVRGLLSGLAQLQPSARPRIGTVASRVSGVDPIADFGFPLERHPFPSPLLTRVWSLGFGRPVRARLVHAPSFVLPPGDGLLVVTVHDLAWRRYPDAYPPRGRAWHEAALHRALDRGSAFVVPSQPIATQLIEAGAIPSAVHVIEEGSDHLAAPDDAGARALLARLGVRGEFLLAVGTLEPRKNLPRLLEAYRAVRSSLTEPWPLLVVGPEGWGSDPLEVPDGVVLTGHVSNGLLAALYRSARLVCYVPLEEGFGLPVVEAMRSGSPVVSSAVPAAGGATQLVLADSPSSIAEGILLIASDESRRAELVAAGHRRTTPLTWQKTAEKHVALWRSLLDGGTG